ncbi:hypothetical protein NQ318_020600 [Aromia moschata]|uniref:Mitochondrial cardiolipin hydrolase n=1 Tax=Aromia moschata TaxID=1265417 RepID=A0AAV8Z0B2_9CUCU|nr:hypothetical protein NQ318_020600 [Aromia moschata]
MNKLLQPVIFIALSSLPLIINYFLKRRYRKLIEELKIADEYYHQNFNCKQHLIDRTECSENCSYAHQETLVKFISSAKTSINLCMYTFSLKYVNLELMKAHKNGINIRVITDKVMLKTDVVKFNISKLKEKGIRAKSSRPRKHDAS